MSVRVARSSSSSSFSSMSGMSLTQRRVSTRAPSVHGGAGGFGTRVSRSLYRSISGSAASAASSANWMAALSGDSSVVGDEKLTMQNLNDRLASYMEKVHSLESANMKLEMQIRQFYEKRAPSASKDYAAFFTTISDLRSQILMRFTDNQRVVLQMDNAQMAAEDFKLKYETELNMSNAVMADLLQLRGIRDGLTLTLTDVEGQLENLTEELVYMKKNHQEDMGQLRIQCSGNVVVGMENTESTNLQVILDGMREQYEVIMMKNSKEVEQWFQTQAASLQAEITTRTTEANTFVTQQSELKRSYQSLEITRQSAHTEIQCLQQSVEEMNSRFSVQLSQQQVTITRLETEMQQLRASIEQQQAEYCLLLDIKMRLEMEIAEYRRLLEGEYTQQKKMEVVVVNKVEEKVEKKVEAKVEKVKIVEIVEEEYKPHIEKRVRTIVEELVDGQVVSVSTDTQVESIQ